MTAQEERVLTDEGRSLFSKRSGDERAIIAWLLSLDQDWPFTGYDIAAMILAGDHVPQAIEARSDKTGTGLAVGESAVRQDAAKG